MNSTQVSTGPINQDLGNTETSNQETLSSKNTEDFSGQISTDSGIEITTFRSIKDTSTNHFLQANTTFSNSRPTSTLLPTNTLWTTKSIQSNNEDLSPTISSIDLQGDLVFCKGRKGFLKFQSYLHTFLFTFLFKKLFHNFHEIYNFRDVVSGWAR